MVLVICPGVHSSLWTTHFLHQLDEQLPDARLGRLVFPADLEYPWSPFTLRRFLADQAIAPDAPLVFLAFSAGCVAAVGTAYYWTQQGRQVSAVIALDGWGVPLVGPFVGYRLSHDAFTHQTSACLGRTVPSFYADPPVSHQKLWCNPAQVKGWQVDNSFACRENLATRTTALQFLVACLRQHSQVLASF